MNREINYDIIREIIRVSKAMESAQLVNTYEGNLSIKQDGLLYITPARTRKSTLTEDLICVLEEDGTQIHGSKKSSSETIMHRTAYELRDDVSAVIHCHSPYLTAHAMCHIPIDQKCHPEILFHFKDIPVAPYGQPGTRAIIDNAAPYLKNRNLVLLGNHGVLSVGSTLEKAFQRIEAAEKFAMEISITRSLGPVVDIPQSEIERILARDIET
ncbi:class II aldolase/adducin family protein [Lawsonibacter sp. JLR.KK007]|jgi:L-fuculose-phosphate aldolase|uniref:class II aldolase/adducin family protein n=1 Tax=Lawsonibacter sp. JLR.KK007 TaxID=3114293 RepID=UPI002FEFF0C5